MHRCVAFQLFPVIAVVHVKSGFAVNSRDPVIIPAGRVNAAGRRITAPTRARHSRVRQLTSGTLLETGFRMHPELAVVITALNRFTTERRGAVSLGTPHILWIGEDLVGG